MSNDFYTVGGTPSTGSNLQSSPVRTEFALIQTGFDKLPALTANGGKTVRVNAGATALEVSKVTITEPATGSTLTIADGATLATAGAYSMTLTATAATSVTLPTTGTLATLAGAETLTNKTLTAPTLTTPALGTPASGNLASCTGYPGTSALVTVGALNSGSITSGFGSINIGTDTLTAGNTTVNGAVTAGSAGAVISSHTFRVYTDQNFNITTNGGTTLRALTDAGAYTNLLLSGLEVKLQSSGTDVLTVSAGSAAVTGALTCSTGFGCNGAAAQTKYTVNAASTDLATVVALCNQLRAALIANGICV